MINGTWNESTNTLVYHQTDGWVYTLTTDVTKAMDGSSRRGYHGNHISNDVAQNMLDVALIFRG